MKRADIDALRAKQVEAQKLLDSAKQEAERASERKEPIDAAVKERATKARDDVVRLGTEIAEAEAEHARSLDDNAEFLRSLAPAAEETLRQTGPDGVIATTEITPDTVDLFHEHMRARYGSRMETPHMGVVDRASEQLVLDMLRCPNDQFPARVGEFAARQRKLKGFQARHATGVTSGGTDQGGYLVPDDNTFMAEVQKQLLAHGGVVNVARIISTPNGRPLPIPTIDDTAATGAGRVAENTASTDVDLTFGEKSMGAHMITSGRLSATIQAVDDAGPSLPMLLGMLAAERIQRKESGLFINGDGAGDPQGLAHAFQVTGYTFKYDISVGHYVLVANDADSTPMWEAFIDVKKAVNAAYRAGPRFSLVTSDQLDTVFARATDKDGRPIFRSWGEGNTAMGAGMRYAGMNIVSDYSIADTALTVASADNEMGWIGDFNWFWIRRVMGMAMIRDPYTNAANLATNWVFGRRCDSRGLFNTGANPAVRQIELDVIA